MDTNEKIKIVGTNIQEKANLIWNVANSKKLNNGKTYFYKVRGIRTIDGKTYYTKWSNVAKEKPGKL